MPKIKKGEKRKTSVAQIHLGDEPKGNGQVASKMEIMKALNWYSINVETRDAHKYGLQHFSRDPEMRRIIEENWQRIPVTSFYLLRMKARGFILSPEHEKKLATAISVLSSERTKSKIKDHRDGERVPIQELVRRKTMTFCSMVDEKIDEFIESGYSMGEDFDAYTWLLKIDVKPVHAKGIADEFSEMVAELKEAKKAGESGGYSHLTDSQMDRFISFVESIVVAATAVHTNKNRARPKAKKAKSADKQVSKLRYMSGDPSLRVMSENPMKVVSSGEVWLYDTRSRTLKCLISADPKGFTVSGSKIRGFCPNKSFQLKVRKPEAVIPGLATANKAGMSKAVAALTTKKSSTNGRVNEDTVILRVF